MFNLFANITFIYLLYLFYGAAFLFLGVSISAKDMKGSDLKLADNLWLLGTFGFLHGAREWLELGLLIEGKNLSFQQLVVEKTAALSLGVISFLFLLLFGISLIQKLNKKMVVWLRAIPISLVIVWGLTVWLYGLWNGGFTGNEQMLQQADIVARYLLGFTGALLTAYGLIAYSGEVRILSPSVAKRLSYAGVTFIFYAVFAGIVTTSYFLPAVPIPVEFFRGISACFISYFIVKALNIFDIETRKKIEQQSRRLVEAEKLTSLGQLAAGIAHEINNPLTNASLGIQTLKKWFSVNPDSADVVEKLDAAERNIDRASVIAQELLHFSHQQEYDFIPLDIDEVIQGALTLLQYKLKPVEVVLELIPVPKIMGNPGKLQQVLINVLSNSAEAMTANGTIFIRTSLLRDMVILKLVDTGNGIPVENLSKVFDPFFTTKEIGSGTGLGLSLCYGIIRQHNGIIEISSEMGKGTDVTIKLPVGERHEKNTSRR